MIDLDTSCKCLGCIDRIPCSVNCNCWVKFWNNKNQLYLFLCKLVKVGKSLWFLSCTMWSDYTSWILLHMACGIGVVFNISHIWCVLYTGKCYNWNIFCLLWWFSWSWICCWFRTPQRLNLIEGMCNLECWKGKKMKGKKIPYQFGVHKRLDRTWGSLAPSSPTTIICVSGHGS